MLHEGEFGSGRFWLRTTLGTPLFADGAGDGGNTRSDSQKQDRCFPEGVTKGRGWWSSALRRGEHEEDGISGWQKALGGWR